jgi:4-amino-4-deoxy-L-arabinose transferase-like glycosyltransferase
LRICGYAFFLWASYFWLGVAWVTPDLCLAAIVYLATALLFQIRRGRDSWLAFAALGALLGLGYLAKAAMFPLSFVFLLSAFCIARKAAVPRGAAAFRTLVAAGVFIALALPLIISLSAQKGRQTFGDSGALNYAMYVDGATLWVHWQGQPPGSGVPVHATRELSSHPLVFEFAQPILGSYPPWYDPSYWYEGIKPHFSLRGQAWALFRAANLYLKLISRTGAVYGLFLALVLLGKRTGTWVFETRELFWVWLPSFAAFAMYALVHVEQRYVSGFALMILMWLVSSLRLSENAGGQFRERMMLLAGLVAVLAITWSVGRDLYDVIRNKPYEHWVVAEQLHAMGISPGTDVGYIGTGLGAYWAHLAGVRIVVEVPEGEQPRYVGADAARRQQVLALFSSVGARAIVTRNAAAANSADGWRPIPGTHHFIWQQPWLIAAPEKK